MHKNYEKFLKFFLKKLLTNFSHCGIIIGHPKKGSAKRTLKIKQRDKKGPDDS